MLQVKSSTLHRARPKRLEDLPEWAKCCAEYIKATLESPEIVVDLSRRRVETINCNWCGHEKVNLVGVPDVDAPASACYVALDEYEIDEKPIVS